MQRVLGGALIGVLAAASAIAADRQEARSSHCEPSEQVVFSCRIGPKVAELYLSRSEREGADEDVLDRHDADPALRPPILSIRPAPGAPTVSRLERDAAKMGPALGAGRAAAVRALLDVPAG